jgi:hypothetical protein
MMRGGTNARAPLIDATVIPGPATRPAWARFMPPMNVLLVAYPFPPVNVIGAVRVGKFAKFLHEAGHNVRVIAATPANRSLALEIPTEHVVYVAHPPVDQIFDGVLRRLRRLRPGRGAAAAAAAGGVPPANAPSRLPGKNLSDRLTRHYYALLRIPDARAGWIGPATVAGYQLLRDWRPDIVVGSAPPNSGLIVAARLARAGGAPWVAELRDLWVDNPYYEDPGWRLIVDRFLEKRVLGSAAGLVSATPRWTQTLEQRYRRPAICILNGYVEDDFPRDTTGPPPGDVLQILYTGNIYAGYRDPSPLFRALSLLGAERARVAVEFYGPHPQEVMPLAAAQGVENRVFVHPPVSYKESLALQTAADILLLLQWNNEKDAGNIPAKFFEYVGARRPILFHGFEAGDLAAMISERRAGVVANDPQAIAAQLRSWLAQKPVGIAPIEPRARTGLTRDEQNRRYEQFLGELLLARAELPPAVSATSAPGCSLP